MAISITVRFGLYKVPLGILGVFTKSHSVDLKGHGEKRFKCRGSDMKRNLMSAAVAALTLTAAVPAQAITYTGTRIVGTQTAQLSITTDDTLGVLSTANILDWTVILSFVNVPFALFGPLIGGNSVAQVDGDSITALPTDLIFNFDSNGRFLFGEPPGLFGAFYCVDGAATLVGCIGPGGTENISRSGVTQISLDGSAVLASAASSGGGPVPEPGTWALMVGGFGLIGTAIRRRKMASAG